MDSYERIWFTKLMDEQQSVFGACLVTANVKQAKKQTIEEEIILELVRRVCSSPLSFSIPMNQLKRLLKVGNDIIDVLNPHRDANHILRRTRSKLLLFRQLVVRC